MKKIQFTPLREADFPLLLKWLEAPHVKAWWDQDIYYTLALVQEKFSAHTHGISISAAPEKRTYAYIIEMEGAPIGYIQAYNARAFSDENHLDLSRQMGTLAGCDLFIGSEGYLGKGLGSLILSEFCEAMLDPYFDACLVDPQPSNVKAIRCYEKAGFVRLPELSTDTCFWMIRKSNRSKNKF